MVVAIAVFTVCGLSAAANVSGYDRLKAAGFNSIENLDKYDSLYPNATLRMSATLLADGEEVAEAEALSLVDNDKRLEFNRAEAALPQFKHVGINERELTVRYEDGDIAYNWYGDDEFRQSNSYRRYHPSVRFDEGDPDDFGDNAAIQPAERRFIEAVADALIGDMRNYFITDGNHISISLSGGQIPELAQFALAAIAERAGEEIIDNDDFPFALGLDASFTNASLDVELDDQDNIIGVVMALDLASTVDGATHTMGMRASYNIMDIGTTVIETPEASADARPVPPSYFGQ
jgi:hypothetical protein